MNAPNTHIAVLRTILVLLVAFAFHPLYAQDEGSNEAFILQAGSENEVTLTQWRMDNLNRSIVTQVGQNNETQINQAQAVVSAFPNFIEVLQEGRNNSANMQQTGSGNESRLSQDGNNNFYELMLSGNESTTRVMQEGNGNSVWQTVTGDNLDYLIKQKGSNNEIIQIENGQNAPQYQITQQGHGLQLIIVHESLP